MYASTASLDGISSPEAEEGKVTTMPSSRGDQSVFMIVVLVAVVVVVVVLLPQLLLLLSFEFSGLMGEIDRVFAAFMAATTRSVGGEAVMAW